MAITAQQPAWQRWPQQPHNPEYMVVPTTMMPYDTQTVTSGPLQRPMMASDFFPSMSSYRTAPMTNMGGPHYSPHVPFNNYHFGSPSPVTPFKQPNPERPVPRIMPVVSHQSRESSYSHESQSCNMDGSRSPSVKSESTALSSVKSEMSMDGSPKADKRQRTGRSSTSTASRTIDPIIALNEAAEAQFNTPIDTLMRDIQAKRKQLGPKDEAMQPVERLETLKVTKKVAGNPKAEGQRSRRQYKCTILGCNRICKQKTHLLTHIRSHTGEKPYICRFVSCGKGFSQAGNLKTHERRHTKERPFKCEHEHCSKRFAQRGNLRSHLETHYRTVTFECKLDGCNKTFTARGNLKTHQNNFHKQTILSFRNKLSAGALDCISNEDSELLDYLQEIHKNSNKGIKGRGRDSRVAAISDGPELNEAGFPLHHSHTLPPTSQAQQSMTLPHQATYGMGASAMMVTAGPRGNPNPYDMYDIKSENVTRSPPATSPVAMYEDPSRGLSFDQRMF